MIAWWLNFTYGLCSGLGEGLFVRFEFSSPDGLSAEEALTFLPCNSSTSSSSSHSTPADVLNIVNVTSMNQIATTRVRYNVRRTKYIAIIRRISSPSFCDAVARWVFSSSKRGTWVTSLASFSGLILTFCFLASVSSASHLLTRDEADVVEQFPHDRPNISCFFLAFVKYNTSATDNIWTLKRRTKTKSRLAVPSCHGRSG